MKELHKLRLLNKDRLGMKMMGRRKVLIQRRKRTYFRNTMMIAVQIIVLY
ncbi:unnamed protein product [Meloidogyne enterolobii]|uniref:Uncharacterized protein n=1 Tax=Meloidogyne enterolobii TaxID=390850 RepID=A0ACB0ZQW4_MELEN